MTCAQRHVRLFSTTGQATAATACGCFEADVLLGVQMIATQDIPAGAEVINCYGRLSNAELLRGYGFVELTNSNNHSQIPVQFVVRAAAAVASQLTATRTRTTIIDVSSSHADGVETQPAELADGCDDGDDNEEDSGIYDADEDGANSDDDDDNSSEDVDADLEDDSEDESALHTCQANIAHAAVGATSSSLSSAAPATMAGPTPCAAPPLRCVEDIIPDWEDRWALAR